MHEKIQRFSLRKLSVGLASVMVGACIFSVNGKTVKADVTSDQTTQKADVQGQTATTQPQNGKQQTSSAQNSVANQSQKNLMDDLGKQKASTENNQVEAKNQENRLVDQINYKQRLNKKVLATNLIETNSSPMTNGGFDEATWGKLDVNNWKGNVQGDYYQLTDYTGDVNHIIVPNEADFEKAGISTSGKQVGVTSDLMHTIFRDKTTAQDATVAFSKTDNKQVKAINADWDDTWGHNYYNDSNAKLSKFDGSGLNVSSVTDMRNMFLSNQISDLSSLANWKVDNATNMSSMFFDNQISDLSSLANWKTDNVTNTRYMFQDNQISDLSPLANWKVDKVTDMSDMFSYNQISNLSSLANWKVDKVTDMSDMFSYNQISNLSSLANWKVDNVTYMSFMFNANKITDLSPLANWHVNDVITMNSMFSNNQISDLSPLANWKVDNVRTMYSMFNTNKITDISPLANWNVNNVDDMNGMFNLNVSSIPTNTVKAKRIINFVYPDGYTGKKQDLVTQTVDVPTKQVQVGLVTKNSKPSNNILDWVTKTERPISAPIDPVYFQDYTVPTVSNLVPSISTVAKQEADPNKPINVVVTYTVAPVIVHFKDVDENADKDSDAVKQELGKTVQLSGTYGSNVDLSTVKLPANFVLDDTSSNTFGNTTDVYINLKHQHAKSATQAPATRTIVVHMPDGTTKTYVQTIGFVNNLDKDLVTNKTTNIYTVDSSKSNVTVNDQVSTQYQAYVLKDGVVNYAPIKLPHINGYKVKLIQDKANPAMFMVSFVALPQQNNQSNNVQSSQKEAQAKQKQPEPIQTKPAIKQEDKEVAQILDHIAHELMNDDADDFEPAQNDSAPLEAPSDSTQKDDAAKPQKVNAAKHKKHIVKKHVIKKHKKHAKKYHLKRRLRKHSKRSKKRIIKHRKSVSRKFRKHNLKHVKRN